MIIKDGQIMTTDEIGAAMGALQSNLTPPPSALDEEAKTLALIDQLTRRNDISAGGKIAFIRAALKASGR